MSGESLLVWLLLGVVAGWSAGLVINGGSFGIIGNIIIGIIGSFLGGWLGSKLGISGAVVGGFSVAIVVTAVLGAVVLLFVLSLIRRV
ncbi:GlsB/YeaQ/YmgE family stress response membrane protein [Flavobacterium sp. ALD4]|uniref:GlsB/YeaQ/YmgE family stress response membrane protein n=1 Tax=Flavobacterium sp. ALD4 TaxID=2058314 RepID=UPI000C33A7F7|nr:GlsB/YeaQ/YmgE family stress response membrane protein [Flavobacterium sp. ALD4]PKH68495.1 GlsB/YeaQ/YmgE family stress response membrane protein [Flavobacterium sp. ALD4]